MHDDHSSDWAYAGALRRSAPTEAAAFLEFDSKAVGRADGTIPLKYRELIALGVALTTQCKLCLAAHAATLKGLGATREEVAETTFIAAAMRAGAAYAHGLSAIRYFDEADAPSSPADAEHTHSIR